MKHKLNGIFKTNKCPEFYECTDGTFTDNTGKGACSSHGGMLIIGKKTKITPKKEPVFTPEKVQKKETGSDSKLKIGEVFWAKKEGPGYQKNTKYFIDNGSMEYAMSINEKNQLTGIRVAIDILTDIRIEKTNLPISYKKIIENINYTLSDALRISGFKYRIPKTSKIPFFEPIKLHKYFKKIVSQNESQLAMTGIHYFEGGIVLTDAHKLLKIEYPFNFYDEYEKISKESGFSGNILKANGDLINDRYPNFDAVIPVYSESKPVNIVRLYNYLVLIEKLQAYNPESSQIVVKLNNKPKGFSAKLMLPLVQALCKINNNENAWNLYFDKNKNNSSVLFELSDKYKKVNDPLSVKGLLMPVILDPINKPEYNGGEDVDYKRIFKCYYDFDTNNVKMNNKIVDLEGGSINAIFKTNKCPEFYECKDGTFTDKTGKGACSSHGGMLIQGKEPVTKKPAKKVKAKTQDVKKTRNQIIRPYADLLNEAEGEFNVKYNSYKDNLIVKDATWDNKMIPGSDRSSLIGMEKAKEEYVKDYNFYLKQMNLDLERAGYKKSDLKFKIYTLPKERETPVKPERKFRDLERGTKIQFKGSWGGGPYFGFVLSKNKYKDRISYDVKRSNTSDDGRTSKTPETVSSENIISVEEPGPVRLAKKPHTFEKTRQPYVSKEAPDFEKILIDAMTTQQQDYLNAPEIKNSTYAHQMRSALLTYYMILLGLKPGYNKTLFKDSIRRSLKNLRYKEDNFVPLKKAIQYIKEVDQYLEKATPLKLQFTDRFFTKFEPPEKTKPVIVKEYENSNSLDWKGKKIKIVYDKQTVDNYPYGRKRTTVYFSLEFQPKKGMRTVFQSIDPRTGRLNQPKKSTYSKYMLMYRDLSNDFVHYIHYNPNSVKEWLHFFKRMQEWKIIIPDDITQWLNNEFYMTYLVGLKALVNYSYVGFSPTPEVKEYFKKYAHLLTLFVSDVKKRKEVTEIYNKVKNDDVALYAYIPLLENIEKFAGEYDSLEGAKEYFEPDISKYEKQYEVLKEKYEKEKKLNPPKVKKVVDPSKDRPTYEKTIEEIKEMLEKIVPKFYYKVDRFGKPRWGKDEQSSKRILIQIQLDDKEKPYNGYPQQTDLMLDWKTMELKAVTQRHSNQKVYLESERFAMEGTKIPFRTPKKEWKFVKKAIKKYVETYKKLVIEAIKKGNLYQERDHNGPVIDYTYLTYGESVNGINNIDSYQDQFNNYMQSFKKVPK